MAAIYNFPEVKRGDTFQGAVFDLQQDGAPMNLAGASVKVEVRPKSDLSLLAWTWDSSNGTATVAGSTITLLPRSNVLMAQADAGVYYYDLQVTFADGTVVTYLEGTFIINEDITK